MAAGDLTTLENVQAWGGATVSGNDAKTQLAITACSAWIASYLNRNILTATYTQRLNGNGSQMLLVDNYPVQSIAALSINGFDVTKWATCDGRRTVLLGPDQNNIPCPFRFEHGLANVSITYTAGFDATPADLELTVIRLVQWAMAESQRPAQNSKSLGGGETVSFSTATAPKWALDDLQQFKRAV
jgi:hypothetical protein